MLRIIVQDVDTGNAVHVGGPVTTELKTFDADLPELEAYLRDWGNGFRKGECGTRRVIGVEILSATQEPAP